MKRKITALLAALLMAIGMGAVFAQPASAAAYEWTPEVECSMPGAQTDYLVRGQWKISDDRTRGYIHAIQWRLRPTAVQVVGEARPSAVYLSYFYWTFQDPLNWYRYWKKVADNQSGLTYGTAFFPQHDWSAQTFRFDKDVTGKPYVDLINWRYDLSLCTVNLPFPKYTK